MISTFPTSESIALIIYGLHEVNFIFEFIAEIFYLNFQLFENL